jgi:hypothetical protein
LIIGIKHINFYINGTDDKMVRTGTGTANCNSRGIYLKQSKAKPSGPKPVGLSKTFQ